MKSTKLISIPSGQRLVPFQGGYIQPVSELLHSYAVFGDNLRNSGKPLHLEETVSNSEHLVCDAKKFKRIILKIAAGRVSINDPEFRSAMEWFDEIEDGFLKAAQDAREALKKSSRAKTRTFRRIRQRVAANA